MNMKTAKKASDIQLAGILAELHTKDGTVIGVTLKDAHGGIVSVQDGAWSTGIDVLVPEPPKKVERFEVAGKFKGIAFFHTYETEREALDKIAEIGVDADPIEMRKIEIPEPA